MPHVNHVTTDKAVEHTSGKTLFQNGNVVRVGEFAWSKMEPDEGKMDFSFFRRVFDQLHAAGIDVVLCTPTATRG